MQLPHFLQMFRIPFIVGIQKSHPLGMCCLYAEITGRIAPGSWLITMQDTDAWISKVLYLF